MRRLTLVLLLALCLACQTPRQSVSLLELLPVEHTNLVAPEAELGHDASAQFLKGRWLTDGRMAVALSKPGATPPQVRFLVRQKADLLVELVGQQHPPDGPSEVALSLNGKRLGRFPLGPQWETIRLPVNADGVLEGENLLAIEGEGASAWRTLRVRPAFAARTLVDETPSLGVVATGQGGLQLPHSSLLELPVQLQGRRRRLRFGPVTQWLEAGAAPLTSTELLSVRLRSDTPPYDRVWPVMPGRPSSVPIPDELGEVTVSLYSSPKEQLLKGQLGWTIPAPTLEFVPDQPRGTPSPPPSLETPLPPPTKEPPNLVLYLVDTLRADHLRCYGYHRATSPNFDALAQDGVRFEEVTAHCSWTKPSTATVLTGLHPTEHGVHDHGDMLPEELETLAERLNAHGYQSYAFMANAFASSLYGMMQGFEEELMIKAPSQQLHERVKNRLDRLEPDKPFFLYVHSMDPHGPYQPPEGFNRWSKDLKKVSYGELWSQSRKAQIEDGEAPPNLADVISLYDGEIASNDHSFGLLVEELKRRGLYDNTLIVVVSDHGEEFYEHRSFGHGSTLFQEVLRVPWIVKFPNQVAAGTSVGGSWQHLDVAPTILTALGLPVPKSMRGLSYEPEGAPPEDRPLTAYLQVGQDVRPKQTHRPYLSHLESLRQGTNYYIECFASLRHGLAPRSLFELTQDPGEQQDLWSKFPVRAAHLRAALRSHHQDKLGPEVEKAPSQTTNEHLRDLQYLR